jgi:hypothetical protein
MTFSAGAWKVCICGGAKHYPKMQSVMDEKMPKTSKCVPGRPILSCWKIHSGLTTALYKRVYVLS